MRTFVLALATTAALSVAAVAEECPSCSHDRPEGVHACWACGERVPGGDPERGVVPSAVYVSPLPEGGGGGGEPGSVRSKLAALDRWIARNPDAHAERTARLEALLEEAEGTEMEAKVLERLAQARRSEERARALLTPKEREDMAARMIPQVMAAVRARPDDVEGNVAKLERLLGAARGTSYESYVEGQLRRQREKLED